MYFFWLCSLFTTHFICQPFVIAHSKPIFLAVGGVCLQQPMQLLDMSLCYLLCGMVDNIVDTTEMIDSLQNIVDASVFGGDAESIGFEDITGLLFCQTAPFDVVRVVGEINLSPMIDTSFEPDILFFYQPCQ